MSKPSAKPSTAKEPEQQASRLDDRIYDLSVKTAKSVQRYRIAILSLICVVVAVIFSVWAFRQYTHAQKAEVSAQLSALLEPDGEGNPPAAASVLPDLQSIVDTAHARGVGRRAAKDAVDFLLAAVRKEFAADQDESPLSTGGDIEEPAEVDSTETSETDVPLVLKKVEEIVQATRSRYSNDPDIVLWADESLRAVTSYRDRKTPDESRAQKPVLPPKPDSE